MISVADEFATIAVPLVATAGFVVGVRLMARYGGIFALHVHCALLLDYVPPEEPPSKPLGNALRIR